MSSLLLIIAIIIIGVAIVVVGPIVTRKLNVKVNLCIIGGYLALLTVLTVICLFIPAAALRVPVDPDTVAQINKNGDNLGANISAGNFDTPEGFTRTETRFDAPSGSLLISSAGDLNGMVFVGTKGVDVPDNGSDQIEVYSYATGIIGFYNEYHAAQIAPPVVTMEGGNNLIINPEPKKQIHFYQFYDANALPQFFAEPRLGGNWSGYTCLTVVVLLPPGVSFEGSGFQPFSALAPSALFNT